MRTSFQRTVACIFIIAAGVVAGLTVRLKEQPLDGDLKLSDPNYQRVMCGPVSLSTALGRLGVGITPNEIATKCKVGRNGVALRDLQSAVSSNPAIEVAAKRLTWQELRAHDGVAILFVNGDHYIAVDPRETLPGDSSSPDSIRAYDRDVPASWYKQPELEHIWSGEALVLTKRDSRSATAAPYIVWDECYIDKGIIATSGSAAFRFAFHNQGREDLLIKATEASCGCLRHTVTSHRLAPQESATIDVEVDLSGKEGYVQQYIAVKTNDPQTPVSLLRMACGTPRRRSVSSEMFRVDLQRGGSADREFVVADPAFAGIIIREAKWTLVDGKATTDELPCTISWKRVKDDSLSVSRRTGFSTSPMDCLVQLSFEAADVCPVGPYKGHVHVDVDIGGSIRPHTVVVEGSVVEDVYAVPQVALITLGLDSSSSESTSIRLHSRSNRALKVLSASSMRPDIITVTSASGLNVSQRDYIVTACIPDLALGAAPFQGQITFDLEGGAKISVPVTAFRPPQAGRTARPIDRK